MTISAQTSLRAPADSGLAERPTHGINARHPFAVDAYALLDHRTQERTILAESAPPGRYLSLEREDDDTVRLIALERPITHIGRGLIADVRLEDAHVSRRHAIVALRGDRARVLDDRSSNGTFVNGRAITIAELSDGDVLRFGRAVFRYTEIAPRRSGQPLRRIPLGRRPARRRPGLEAVPDGGGAAASWSAPAA
jgi:hypothetical protein